jgi:uncharacterized membrane protein (GlpM family)
MNVLLLKVLLVPSLIALVTLAGRRWGQRLAGWLGGFPIVAGPVLLVLAIENGNAFAAEAAFAALVGLAPAMLFYLAYTRFAIRVRWFLAAPAALVCWVAAIGALHLVQPTLWLGLLLGAGALWLVPRLMPMAKAGDSSTPHPAELASRMVVGAAVTVFSSELGRRGGAQLSGYAALFPSIGLVVATFNHAQGGAQAATLFLRGMTRGMWSVASFCLTLMLVLPRASMGVAFLAATLVAMLTHLLSRPAS